MIPLADPKKAVNDDLIKEVADVLHSGRYILGDKTKIFEKNFAEFTTTSNAIAVSSGTAALHLSLLACGIKPGDEVITTPFSFIATANPIVLLGAKPVFVDIKPETYNIDPNNIEEKITENTKAIMPVHLYGHPVDMDPILELSEKHGLKVIEDGCQAHGATYKGRTVGSLGDVGCFSFFPSKVMTTFTDGGMVTTNDSDIAEKIRMYRNQGRRSGEKYHHEVIGFNYRMSDISAALGTMELRNLPEWTDNRRRAAKIYSKLLGGLDQISTPIEKVWAKHVYYVYSIRTKSRDELRNWLGERGIATGIYYPCPIHLQPAYKRFKFKKGMFPISEKCANEVLSLPMHQFINDAELETVAKNINEFCLRRPT